MKGKREEIANGVPYQKFSKPYNPSGTEDRIYEIWEKSGFFRPKDSQPRTDNSIRDKVFSIVLPPPNVTGNLHMGHAAMLAVEDVLVRFERMRGKRTLWLPGTDHAAIATQSKVESIIYKKERKTRHDLGRKELLRQTEEFAAESHDTIVNQMKKMGASLDWSREAYTLDEKRSLAVRTAFKRMYDDGLIYRGARIVNWDPKMQTTVSDEEVERKEEKTKLYYLKYGPFVIGTARPETKFGDKYVVMHPDDKRYKRYQHGDRIELEWINGPITATVIKDTAIDMEFGTGVMTITPWHSAEDFEIAERNNLDKEQIIDWNGTLLSPIAGEFADQHITKARPLIVEKLKKKGLIEKIDENYTHSIATNSRGGGVLEPQIKEQWFVNVNAKFKIQNSKLEGISSGEEITLREMMRKMVESGQIEIIPDNFKKIYLYWIENLRDWCISRQIWYGHQIPVWYCRTKQGSISNFQFPISKQIQNPNEQKNKFVFDIKKPRECPFCKNCDMEQDPDTLDTWFSSGLWTFSTLGWPLDDARGKPTITADGKVNPESDLGTYHPTTLLETGYDILFFWVARMILMSGYHLGEIPFKTVYLHGLVRDTKGKKMSKSLGNVIDPLDMIEKFGADATRLSLIVGAPPGADLRLSEDKVRAYKHFANKIWNISRFVLTNTEDLSEIDNTHLNAEDKKMRDELDAAAKEITNDLDNYRLHLASEKLYQYLWHRFADVILEESKPILNGDDEKAKKSRQIFLYSALVTCLKLLHPFMPFVTEEIWQEIPHKDSDLLMIAPWPAK